MPAIPPLSDEIDEKQPRSPKAFSFEGIAMGGPGLVALVQMPDLKICFVNHQFENYLGYSNEDICSQATSFMSLLDHYQVDRLYYQLRNVKETVEAQSRDVVYRLRNKNGDMAPYHLYAAPATAYHNVSPAGSDQMYHFVLHPNLSQWDIPFSSFVTRELFLEHFNSEDFGTFEWILNIDKVFLSEGVYDIFEIEDTLLEINERYMWSFIHPEDSQRLIRETKRSIVSGDDLNTDFRIITVRRQVKIIHCLARAIKNADGDVVKIAGSIRDITGQRLIEEDLKNKVTELYHSNRELEEFAYIASHDMQEPLRKITIFSDRLAEKYKDALAGEGAMYLSRMVAAAENMRLLIDGLLEFSRITKTKQPFEAVNLDVILKQVKTDLELAIEETGASIQSHPLPTVAAVASQMKQLLVNIIGNAIKFHKPGVAPVITVECALVSPYENIGIERAKDTEYYKVSVTDNGVGFEDEYAIRIFQVFQRLHGKSEYPGSGIGLAICKKILEYHKGAIYAENLPGLGARFTFILPQRQVALKETGL